MVFTLPIYWAKGVRKQSTHLAGMNWFRNANHFDQAKMKNEFTELLLLQLRNVGPVLGPYQVNYSIYYKNPSCDGSNIAALIEKIFLDGLQQAGITREDNVTHHLGSSWSIAGQDKLNPRCEITISPVDVK